MNRKILNIALPSIISNITVPLLGLVDLAIVGHLGDASYIGAIAVGGLIFNIIYWLFGFLRMGTSGITAQSFGKRDLSEARTILYRVGAITLIVSIFLILLQVPIKWFALKIISPTEDVVLQASIYFNIVIYGAPAVLGLYSFTGWFIGMQNSRIPMFIAIVQNVANIVISLFLVELLGMKVAGVAYGTMVAQYIGLLMAIYFWRRYYSRRNISFNKKDIFDKDKLLHFFSINRDIFLRTLCLICVTTFFTSAGAREGDLTLAVNTVLLQFFTLFSYVMDGFAYSGEALAGRFVGAKDKSSLTKLLRALFLWGISLAFLFTLLYGFGGDFLMRLLTNDTDVISGAANYFGWIILLPLVSFAAFLWDGILIGATATRLMLYSMGMASAAFFILYYSTSHVWGNNSLWLAFLFYLFVRGIMEWVLWRKSNILGSWFK